LVPLIIGIAAIAVKKRNLWGPLTYAATHLLTLFGLIAGALTTEVKAAQDYPLDVIEGSVPEYAPVEINHRSFAASDRMIGGRSQ